MPLNSDVMTTPVNTYLATSIRKSANFSFLGFSTITFCSPAASVGVSCWGFGGLCLSRRVAMLRLVCGYTGQRYDISANCHTKTLRFFPSECVKMSKNGFVYDFRFQDF